MLKEIWYLLCRSCRPQNNRTVRYAFPLVFVAVLFIGAAAIVSTNESFITIETTPAGVKEGDRFTISISATAHVPVNAVDIVLEYPESQMKVTGIDTGESVISLWTEEPYAEDNRIYLRGGTFQRGFLGEHLIARVRAEAIESGTAHVNIDSITFIAGDGRGTEVRVTGEGTSETQIPIANADGTLVGKASVFIITDIDGDGSVGLNDISAFMAAWFRRDVTFDFNGDGRMTIRDFSILLADSFFK